MRRVGKTFLKVLAWALGAFVVIYSVAYLKFNDEVLGKFISERVNKVERGSFQLQKVHFNYFGGLFSALFDLPTRAYGAGYTLHDPDGNLVIECPYAETDVYVQELLVSLGKYALSGNFTLDLHFRHAHAPRGIAMIKPTRSSWGKTIQEVNIVAAMSPKYTGPVTTPMGEFKIRVDDIVIDDVHFGIAFPNAQGGLAFSGRFMEANARAALQYSTLQALATTAGPWFFFKVQPLHADEAELRLGDQVFPLGQLDVSEFGPDGAKREDILFRGKAKTMGADLGIDGALTDSYSMTPGARMTLAFEHGAQLEKLLPPPLSSWLGGDPSGKLSFEGPFSHVVTRGEVRGASMDIDGIPVSQVEGRMKLDAGKLTIEEASAHAARGHVHGSAEVALTHPAHYKAHLVAKGLDPAQVPHLPPEVRTELEGKLDADVHLAGSLEPSAPPGVSAVVDSGTLERNRAGRLPKVMHFSGKLELSPTLVKLTDAEADGEGLRIGADGTVDPRDGRIDTRLSIDATRGGWLARLGAPKYLKVDKTHATGSALGTLGRPVIGAHLTVEGVSLGDRTLETVDAEVKIAGGMLKVSEINGAGFGGQIDGHANFGLYNANGDITRPLKEPTMDVALEGNSIAIGELLGRDDIAGPAKIELRAKGPAADPKGEVSVDLPSVKLKGDPYEKGQLELTLGEGGAQIKSLSLQRKGGGKLTGDGKVGWDGTLALHIQPDQFPIAAIPGISGLPVTLGGTLSGDLKVEGDEDHPDLSGWVKLRGARLRDALLGDGKLTFEHGADAIHLRGNLFGLVDVDGYLTLFPKFTVTGTMRFRDLALEKYIPEMRQLAEIKTKASGEARIAFDGQHGLTFAGLAMSKLELLLTGIETDGRPRQLAVRNQEPVQLSTDGQVLRIERAHLASQNGEFTILGTVSSKDNDVHVQGNVELGLMEYFFRGAFEHTHGSAKLDLSIKGDLTKPALYGWLDLRDAMLQPRGVTQQLMVPRGRLDFLADQVKLSNLTLKMGAEEASASGWVKLKQWVPGEVHGEVHGKLDAHILQWLFNDYVSEASGRIDLGIQLAGTFTQPIWSGGAELFEARGKLRRWEHELSVKHGLLAFQGSDIRLQSIQGGLDDQPVTLDGKVGIGPAGLRSVDVSLSGTELRYNTDEYAVTFSPRVRIHGDAQRITADGRIDLNDGRYFQNFDVIDAVIRPSRTHEREKPFWLGYPLLENMALELHLQSTGPLWIKNNLADLYVSTSLDVAGTLSEPKLDGSLHLDAGGTFKIPGFKVEFTSKPSLVNFDPEKKMPEQTPTLEITAEGSFQDRNDGWHLITMKILNTIPNPQMQLTSQEGWDQASILIALLSGSTPEELRRSANSGGDPSRAAGPSATESVMKSATGILVGQQLANPIQKLLGLDQATVEFGSGSFDVKACKRISRNWKTCGTGEVGFAGSSKVKGEMTLRLSDYFGMSGAAEYLTHGVETSQDSLTRAKLELKLQIPLGH